jgi:hypothetical protein
LPTLLSDKWRSPNTDESNPTLYISEHIANILQICALSLYPKKLLSFSVYLHNLLRETESVSFLIHCFNTVMFRSNYLWIWHLFSNTLYIGNESSHCGVKHSFDVSETVFVKWTIRSLWKEMSPELFKRHNSAFLSLSGLKCSNVIRNAFR